MFVRTYWLLCLTPMLLPPPAHAPSSAHSAAPVVYSSIQYVEEGGDAVGTEVILLHDCGRLFLSYQEAEGGILAPHLVTATERADTVSFVIPPDSGVGAGTNAPSEVTPARTAWGVLHGRALVLHVGDIVDTLPRRRRAYVAETLPELRRRAAASCGAAPRADGTAPLPHGQ